MCGRFALFSDLEEIGKEFNIDTEGFNNRKSYNIAPGSIIAAVIFSDRKRFVPLRWGFIWSRQKNVFKPIINARAESLRLKPSFHCAFKRRRCLVLANGYFEWRVHGNQKIPYFIRLKSRLPFGFAALYESFCTDEGKELPACAIITTEANELTSRIHNRMPAIIAGKDQNIWLHTEQPSYEEPFNLLKPYESCEMEVFEVSKLVNSPRNDTPEIIQPKLIHPAANM
ncbi:MAG: SOS response-associated peptidase [Syntrophales bacterium]|jgi:putative SOS response-associated peptidase YedK|nr:SOS response-associated peptidase [Syntrophales bacterium]MDY0043418.1 SOS response-associated peptidase [Syntrophales bacterium]